jgi:hydroxymethylbilane synthase
MLPNTENDMNDAKPIRIGTRASLLARTQTEWVVGQLRSLGHAVEIETINTIGDTRTDTPIARIGGDGVFVRELERALLDGRIDAAVHSLKDLPSAETPGLSLACVPRRATPFDALVARGPTTLASLPAGAVVGTSSVRRVMQVKAARPDLVVRPVRGNVDTRLKKLDDGEFDVIILAAAGLERLGLSHRITELLRPDSFWPAVAQGALVVQIRDDDDSVAAAVASLDDLAAHDAVRAERSFLAALAGGCLAPIGGWAHVGADGRLELGGCVLEDRGGSVERIAARAVSELSGGAPEALGRRVADDLRRQGADAMLARMRQHAARTPETR